MPSSDELRFAAYCPGDEQAIMALFLRTFGRELSVEEWSWRFRAAPAREGIIELAWSGDTLAGHYAVTPVTITIDNEDCASALSGTTMTHPGFRGRRLFPQLANRCYERMQLGGMTAVWGFPNASSHRGFVQDLGWTDLAEIPIFRWHVAAGATFASAAVEVVEIDARFDALWRATRDQRAQRVTVKRDSRYLDWRYRRNASQRYTVAAIERGKNLCGYAVFKTYHDELQIMDLLAIDETVACQLVEHVMGVAVQQGRASVGMWLNFTTALHRLLERSGFHPESQITYLGVRPFDDRNRSYLCSPSAWQFAMGDSDVF